MQYPLIDRNVLADLRLIHAFFNSGVMALFFYQAWLGITVRRARLAGGGYAPARSQSASEIRSDSGDVGLVRLSGGVRLSTA